MAAVFEDDEEDDEYVEVDLVSPLIIFTLFSFS